MRSASVRKLFNGLDNYFGFVIFMMTLRKKNMQITPFINHVDVINDFIIIFYVQR